MPEYDLERINKIILDIERFFTDLDEIKIKSVDDLKNKKNFYAVSMIIFAIINRAVDLGDEILASLNIGVPSKYADIFYLLKRDGHISRDLTQDLTWLVDARNLLSHEYQDFDGEDILDIMGKVQSIKEFVENMKNLINK